MTCREFYLETLRLAGRRALVVLDEGRLLLTPTDHEVAWAVRLNGFPRDPGDHLVEQGLPDVARCALMRFAAVIPDADRANTSAEEHCCRTDGCAS